ncbi:Arylsulfate sulfotransferase [Sphingomonas sp. 8AM]|nr:Arylsulfate sulfotransferase [Sphingomonas sp. 8AM]
MGSKRLIGGLVAAIIPLLMLAGCGDSEEPLAAVPESPVTVSVEQTVHPLIARLKVPSAKASSTVEAEFGPTTSYGFSTSKTSVTAAGLASLLIAGMRANATYHMRAKITDANGSVRVSDDVTFTTGSLPENLAAVRLKAETAAGQKPSPGVELISTANASPYQPYVVDLQGNIIWYYPWSDHEQSFTPNGIEQLANGNFISSFGPSSTLPISGKPDPTKSLIREFNLLGETVKQLSIADLNTKLAAVGFNVQLGVFHHHVEVLPNGHWLLLANTVKVVDGLSVLGDVVIDVDADLKPTWVWNSFDHLDVARHPMGAQDWTHANAVTYSPTDGNFLISIRHQHWVVKVNYRNGQGDGSSVWRLGPGGDFKLTNGKEPTDWQYAQHYPEFVSQSSAGVFDLSLMDNGNERVNANGGICGNIGVPPCYTTMPIFRVDEQAKLVTIRSRVTLPPELYSRFGGNAEVLDNGNFEFDLCGVDSGAVVQERTSDDKHELVWSLTSLNGAFFYRAFRMKSLYPGVTWVTL